MQWFRFYSEALDDPKVQRLPGDLFKAWINLLCLANLQEERGTLPSFDDIAFRLRMDDGAVATLMVELARRGLLDDGPHGYHIHGWAERQYRSDADPTAAERKRRQRDRERDNKPVTRDISVTAENVTRTDTDTEAEKIQKQKQMQSGESGADAPTPPNVRPLRSAAKKDPAETRIPDDFPLTDNMRDWAREKVPRLDLDWAHEEFCTYWRSVKTKRVDWEQTWQNGMIKAYGRIKDQSHAVNQGRTGQGRQASGYGHRRLTMGAPGSFGPGGHDSWNDPD